MNIRNEILETDCYYHIYNRGINGCTIISTDDNYLFFLEKFKKYMEGLCEVYSYCLMSNHFHFLIKIKSDAEINDYCVNNLKINHTLNSGLHSSSNIVSKQIGKVISSYSQAYNKAKNRHGSLLESPFKRIKVTSDEYLKNLILYIHQNPIKADFELDKYKFSSYRAIISNKETNINREEVLKIFDSLDNFVYSHKHIENNFGQIIEL
jgi:REP element-mobilizing transposase RayT